MKWVFFAAALTLERPGGDLSDGRSGGRRGVEGDGGGLNSDLYGGRAMMGRLTEDNEVVEASEEDIDIDLYALIRGVPIDRDE